MLSTFVADLMLKTLSPLAVVLVLVLAGKRLHKLYGANSSLAAVCSDLWFYVVRRRCPTVRHPDVWQFDLTIEPTFTLHRSFSSTQAARRRRSTFS